MSVHKIEGSPGTLPQGGNAVAAKPAPAIPEILGVLRFEGGHVYVEARGERIRIDDRSAARLLGSNGLPTTRPVGRPSAVGRIPQELVPAVEAVRNNRSSLEQYPGVVGVRAGYKFIGGRITEVPSVVVSVSHKLPGDKLDAHQRLPTTVDGVALDVAPADPYELLSYRRKRGEHTEAVAMMRPTLIDQLTNEDEAADALEVSRNITYEAPPGATLSEVSGEMTIICHVSPDAGWRVLEPFIKATKRTREVGMYDFTAPHIYRTTRSLLRDGSVEWQMTLGPNESLPGPDDAESTHHELQPGVACRGESSRTCKDFSDLSEGRLQNGVHAGRSGGRRC